MFPAGRTRAALRSRANGRKRLVTCRRTHPNLVLNDRPEAQGYGFARAFDMKTGDKKWDAGVLSTASDLVFSGGREGYFYASNARTGEQLWRTSLGGHVTSELKE
jgi:alcohol dehydrogenase (cytochrome c)